MPPPNRAWVQVNCPGLLVSELVHDGSFEDRANGGDEWRIRLGDVDEAVLTEARAHTGRWSLLFRPIQDQVTSIWNRPAHHLWPDEDLGHSGDLVRAYLSMWVWWGADGATTGDERDKVWLEVNGCARGTNAETCSPAISAYLLTASGDDVRGFSRWIFLGRELTHALRLGAHAPDGPFARIAITRFNHPYDDPATVLVDDVSLLVCTRP